MINWRYKMIKNKNIRIVMINPQSPFLINKNVFPPLGLLTLSAFFKKHGYNNIKFIDMNNGDHSNVKGDLFFIYVATPNLEFAKETMVSLRKNNISAKFIVGGPHATLASEDCMWADAVVIGEGELASLQILKDYPNIKKVYRETKIENLDDIPFPDRSILDIKEYANNYKLRGVPTTTLITSRGCSWGKCSFCCKYWTPDSKIRYRSAQNIVDEIKDIQEKYDIHGFMAFDDEFVHNKRRLKEFCELVTPLNIKWRCLSRIESINNKIVPIMRDAGCVEIAVGIESADQDILDTINKHIDITKAERACQIIKDNGIDLKELFIIGLPGESRESLQKIDEFVEKTQPVDVDFTILSVFPGSDIHENPEKYPNLTFKKGCRGWYKGIPGNYNTLCKISTPTLTFDELVAARDALESKYKPLEKLMKKE
jgi:anaerobic magnesium-protoporphyrin IX monomethyl ester cyclase